MMGFAPPATSDRSKLDDGVQWNFDLHTLLDAGIPEVGHQALNNADVTHNQRRHYLLLNIDHNACQARH
jgi:hypothetical protein